MYIVTEIDKKYAIDFAFFALHFMLYGVALEMMHKRCGRKPASVAHCEEA